MVIVSTSSTGEVISRPVQVKFFYSSFMNIDKMEAEINKFCKEYEVLKVDMIELSKLVIIMVVYR